MTQITDTALVLELMTSGANRAFKVTLHGKPIALWVGMDNGYFRLFDDDKRELCMIDTAPYFQFLAVPDHDGRIDIPEYVLERFTRSMLRHAVIGGAA